MQQNTNTSSGEARAIRLQEITDFEISISNGLYWISYEERHYPVILTPYHFKRLFEFEGLPIEDFTGDEPVRFTKTILQRREQTWYGDLYDEEKDDVTPQACWVKETSESNSAEGS